MSDPVVELEVPIFAGPEIVKRFRVSADVVAELLEIARGIVDDVNADGAACDDPTLACDCFVCRGIRIRILVEVEGPGRCVICGCTEHQACFTGCGWADETKRICDRHPPEDVATARLVLAREAGDVQR